MLTNQVSEIINYRQGRRDHLKRTFVSATDATRSKLLRTDLQILKKPMNFIQETQTIQNENKTQHYISESTNYNSRSGIKEPFSSLSDSDFKLLDKVRRQPGFRGKVVITISSTTGSYSCFNVVQQAASREKFETILKKTGKVDEKCQW